MEKHQLPVLEYEYDSLEPYIDAKTMEIHHTKHHQAYIDKLNGALEKYPELFEKTLNELLEGIAMLPEDIKPAVRNNGGGHFNHSLFWTLMTGDKEKNVFQGRIAEAIKKDFGSWDDFRCKFEDVALSRFGSGWVWLVLRDGRLEIYSTANQDSPVMEGLKPILGLDVWEHAYYLKYQNKRAEYVKNWWNVVNWEKVNEIYEDIERRKIKQ